MNQKQELQQLMAKRALLGDELVYLRKKVKELEEELSEVNGKIKEVL